MNRQYMSFGFGDWALWTASAAIVLPLVFWISLLSIKAAGLGAMEDRLAGYFIIPLLGLLLGVTQWLILNQSGFRGPSWIFATFLGYLAALALGHAVGPLIGPALAGDPLVTAVVGALLFGLTVGGAQWVVLRRYVSASAAWLPVNAAGLALGIVLIAPTIDTPEMALFGAAPAAVTGLFLMWATRPARRPDDGRHSQDAAGRR